MSAPSTIGDASHADKIAEIHRLRDVIAALLATLEEGVTVCWGNDCQVWRERACADIAAARETFTTGHARQGVAP